MLTIIVACIGVFSALVWWFSRADRGDLDKIPGPDDGILGSLFAEKTNPLKNHLNWAALKDKYGPICKITMSGKTHLILSDYKSIYEVLVSSGKQFGGRRSNFHYDEAMKNTGILLSHNPDDTWRLLRKLSQKHLHQFGDGMSKLETIITDVAEDMFEEFERNSGKPLDPKDAIFDTALISIAFLITGERMNSGDRLVEAMREYEDLFLKSQLEFGPKYFQFLNTMPWLKYFGFCRWKPFNRFCELQNELWDMIKENTDSNPDANNICKVLREHLVTNGGSLQEVDAQMTTLSLLFAGVTTTSTTFTAAVNILAHHRDIQQKIFSESQEIMDQTGQPPTLADRSKMPYTRAVIYEILRYTSITAEGVVHRTVEDSVLHGYKIPADTEFSTSFWNLHHDESIWQNPYEFNPERFLDDDGEIVLADHPNRKHLMQFGAGTRVCLGETLALARLFLWTATLATRFEVQPAPGNEKESVDPRGHIFIGVVKPNPYKVVFCPRK